MASFYGERKPVTATVYPKNGTSYTGYVIDGKTYKDAAGTQRIDSGSDVQLADGRRFTYNAPVNYNAPASSTVPGSGVTKTKITDRDGNVGVGYIINGQTYLDEAGTQRIKSGTTVETAGGSYYYDAGMGGVPTVQTARNEYQKLWENAMGMYGEGTQAQNKAVDAAVAAAAEEYALRRQQIRDNYARANEDAEAAYIKASNPYGPIGQRLEALGLGDSGYAETTYANLGNEYQRQLSENNRAMEAAIAELDLAEAKARYDGDIQKANAIAAEKQQLSAMWMQMGGTLYSADASNLAAAMANTQNRENTEYNRKWAEREYADAQAAKEEAEAQQTAMMKLQAGILNEDVAKALNLTLPELQKIYAASYAPQPTVRKSGTGSKGGGTTKKTPNLEGAYQAFLNAPAGYDDIATFSKANYKAYNFDNQTQMEIALAGMVAEEENAAGGTMTYGGKPIDISGVINAGIGPQQITEDLVAQIISDGKVIPVEENGVIKLIPGMNYGDPFIHFK